MNNLIGLVLFLSVEMIAPAHAEQFGRLFFSASERSRLELQESKLLASTSDDSVITVNGIIKRNDGSRIVWINGRMQETVPEKYPNIVTVPIPGKPGSIEIAVGQRIVLDKDVPAATGQSLAPDASAP